MMHQNWLVNVANKDRAALRALGVPAAVEKQMDHREVVQKLKELGYRWK